MSNTERKKILNYRTANGILPNPDNIDYGEIAIGYKKDNEAIYIKNTANNIVDFTPISIVNLTYNELKELRDSSNLKPSQYYRITDFVTTVANDPEAQSARHPFDIIVMASDKNKLQDECYAIQRENDEYFANCNLAAWKIWYCLDNDTTKYMWADTANGKGVIYRMIDEWNNDCPYDFKNVQFKRYWANGINITKNEGEPKDIILQGYYGTASNTDIFTEGVDTNDYLFCFTFTRLNNISVDYLKGSVIQSNVLDESIQTEGFDIDAKDDKLNNSTFYHFHNKCRNNILKSTENGLVVDTKEYMAFALLNNVFITVKVEDGYEAYQPPFDNTLGVSCVNNTFGSNNCGLLFLSGCVNNTFGNKCKFNTFGDGCYSNIFGNECLNNSFGNYFNNNTFGGECSHNSFGNGCYSNTFGNICNGNTFGNACIGNEFGNVCFRNSFGNDCYSNIFGNECLNNSFGNECGNNSFGKYFKYNAIGNDVRYIEIPTEKIYHTQILNGTQGTPFNKLTIEFTPETTYSQFAGLTSDGVLEIWVDADAPHSIINITYNELKNLRDNSKLKPSQYYRITDFVTTVANDPEAQSAGHPFDIIVMASDKNKLQEECYAIQHEGNTYFDNCNLAAWKIWYCLDNDNTKYAWADTVKGKGVIYRMIDEWGNDCPYDFKNVQFKRYAVADASSNGALADLNGTYIGYNRSMNGLRIPDQSNFKWMYTFSLHKEDEYVDYSSNGLHGPFTEDVGYFTSIKKGQCEYNTLSNTYGSVNIDGQFYVSLILNNIVLISEIGSLTETLDFPSEMIYNTFGTANFNMTLKNNPESNKFDNRCYDNIVDGYANTFGSSCSGNTFGSNCRGNTFGNNCDSNTFGRGFTNNSFGNICDSNTFGISCYGNKFGNDCGSNTFGDGCESNSFGYRCYSNSFGNDCYSNSFGNNCNSNSFGNDCNSNRFGDNCWNNSFKIGCVYNSFGNNCQENSFGNYCQNNSFGNYCIYNTFGHYFQYNALGNDVQYINIPTANIYHTHILNGTKGTSSTSKLTITFTPQTKYSQFAGFTSDGVLETWVEADDSNGVDCGTY